MVVQTRICGVFARRKSMDEQLAQIRYERRREMKSAVWKQCGNCFDAVVLFF
jgi:hypothetical protein